MSGVEGQISAPPAANNEANGFNYEQIMSTVKSRKWRETVRPMQSFLAPQKFNRPKTSSEAMGRLGVNVRHFMTNYLLVCLIILTYAILSRPLLLIVGAGLGLAWIWLLRVEEIKVANMIFVGRSKVIAAATATALIVFIFAGSTIFMVVGLCSCVVVLHALFHEVDSDMEGATEMEMAGLATAV